MALTFDDYENSDAVPEPSKPIWAIDLDDPECEKEALQWLQGELHHLQQENEERHRGIQRNLALYKGIQYADQDRPDIRERGEQRNQPVRKIVANHLFDLVQNRVSRLIKFKPAIAVLPTNDELSDEVAAKATKALLEHVWYESNFEGEVTPEFAKQAAVVGESYIFITWNPDKGDLHPDWKKLGKDGKVPLIGEDGNQQKDEAGNAVFIDRPVRVGDVEYEIVLSTEVWLEAKSRFKEVNYLFRQKVMPVEQARILYPKKADLIKSEKAVSYYDYEKMRMVESKNMAVIYEFYHRKSIGMDKGRLIVFSGDVLLDNKPFPYEHEGLPCVRLTDIDLPGELHGRAGIENVKQLTSTYNNLMNLVLRNQILVSHPKWMMPAGAAKKESLGNDITIVEYKGPQPPVLVQANPTSSETFKFMEGIKETAQQIYGVFGVSRGEPPPGIKSGVALMFMSEQENERFNESVLKYNEAIRQIAVMTISVAGTYYDPSDERMVRVLGKSNSWQSQFFDASNLSKDYDVRVQNSSALPQSKAARMDLLFQLSERFPDRFTADQLLDMIDLAQSDKFVDAATINVKLAEAENEMIYNEQMDVEPQEHEDHAVHWRIHVREMQSFSFKYKTPPEVQEKFRNLVMAHEMFMVEQARKNPLMLEKFSKLDGFPLFYVPAEQAQVATGAQENIPSPAAVSPDLPGQVPGLPVNVPPPGVAEQAQAESALPPLPGAVQPTGAI